ncbi:hypothetical protein [Vulcanisaeta distributa]|uniref:hypothetical protein n=1 Tax=Vulcanisaeta distributa TaxID=164451 RepID=UPI001FB2BCE8|nr:hypothetical protein [Vulcanisaeta distributa]
MGKSKRELWGGNIIERLRSLGFREWDERHKVMYKVMSSRAVELARKMLNDSLNNALINDLSSLLDAKKLRNLITLAGTRIKPLGRSSIEAVGVKMNVHVNNSGSVELRVMRRDYEEHGHLGEVEGSRL